jgi:hypothetical protein
MNDTAVYVGEFLRGERNAVRGDFIISREQTKNSSFCFVSMPQEEESVQILAGWAKKVKPESEILATVQEVSTAEPKPKKHTGGKRPYVLLFQDNIDAVKDLSLNASGFLLKVIASGCVEWHTGKVIKKRSKKAMTQKMICAEFGLKSVECKAILKELTEKKIIAYDNSEKAYFINRNFAAKGGNLK